MLQTIRERLTGPIAFFVIGIIGVALVISFGNMDAGLGSGNFAAKVNGEEIPRVEYREIYQDQLIRQQEVYQGELPPAVQQQLQRNVLEGMVRNRLLTQYVRERGYRISDQNVARHIRSLPVFQVGGEFSNQSYIATLSSQGLTTEAFERDQRRSLEINQWQVGLVDSAFFTPSEYRRFIELENERREASYVIVEPTTLAESIDVSEEEVAGYYEQNASRYESEESVALEYVEVTLDDISGEITIEEPALLEYYEANIDRYRSDEQRRARHILIEIDGDDNEAAAMVLANDVHRRLGEGEDFAALAAEYSADVGSAAEGGDLGWAGRDVYVPAFEEALFALEPGEISAPTRTQFGIHIIRLDELRDGEQKPFAEVRDELLTELQRRQAEDRFYALAERVDDLALENPDSLDLVARETGLPLKTAEVVTRTGGEPFGFVPALVDAAFSPVVLEDGENSPLIELSPERAVVVRVAEHRLPKQRPLDEVRDEIESSLRLERAVGQARTRGEELQARIAAGESMAAVVEDMQLELADSVTLDRSADAVPADLLAAIFREPVPAEGSAQPNGISLTNGGYAVYRVSKAIPGRPEDIARQQRDERKQMLARQTGAASASALLADLRAEATVVQAADLFDEEETF